MADAEREHRGGALESFGRDLAECWRRLPNKSFFLVLFAAWVALFQIVGNSTFGYIDSPSLLRWMWNAYRPPNDIGAGDDGHGPLVPLVVAGLFWWKRKELLAQPLEVWWPGLPVVAAGLLLHVAGYEVQQPIVSIFGMLTGLYGLTGLAWGPGWLRKSFFPFVLLIFCVPLGTRAEAITFPLRLLVCQLVEWICHYVLAIDIERIGTAIKDPTGQYQYDVAAACSGMRSLIAILGMALVYGVVTFPQWWKRLVMVASAFPLAVLGNVVRLLTIVIAAEIGGQAAGGYVHEGGPLGILSLLPYVPAFAGLLLVAHWLRKQDQVPVPAAATASGIRPSVQPVRS